MIVKKNKFGFKIIEFWLEDKKAVSLEILKKQYSKIFLLSYKKKDIPGFSVKIKKTPLIRLIMPLEEIFSKFNETARKKIRRSEREDNLKILIEDKNFEEAYKLYRDHVRAYGEIPESREELKKCIIFSAYLRKELISAIFCFAGEESIRAKIICSKRFAESEQEIKKTISNATYGLIWEISQYAKEKKYKYFDLGSVNLDNPARQGNAQFKKSFSPEIVNEYYYVYKSGLYKIFEKLIKIKLLLYKLLK